MTVRALVLALGLVVPATAAAHTEHGGATAPAHGEHGAPALAAGTGVVRIHGYRIELRTHPAPLAVGQSTHLMVHVLAEAAETPVSGGRVRVGLAAEGVRPDARAAEERTWAGSYAVEVTPRRRGPHQVRVVVDALQGHTFEPPLVVDFRTDVASAPGLGAWVWLLLAGVTAAGGVAVYAVAVSARPGRAGEAGFDLLRLPWLRRLLTWPALQPALQAPVLLLTVAVVWLGFVDVQDGGRNLATKLTWTIWWAGIIFTFVLAGRVWCLACPFGALNEWTARLAGAARRLPRPLRNIWWATAAFVLLTWADELLGVVRSPVVTAWLLVFFAALAVAVGLVYERRSFCRYLCPIGGVIGIYSMTAPVELRPRSAATCAGDREKACYRGTSTGPGCPMFEFPGALDRNNYCTLCARCVGACEHGNLALRVRAWGKDLWAAGRRTLDEAYLAVALVGLTILVTAQMLTAWPGWVSALAGYLPAAVRSSLKPVTYLGAVESVLLLGGALLVGPLVVLGGAAVADRLAGPAGLGLRRTFVAFGYMLVPVGLAMHLAHNVAHLLLEGGGILPVVQRAVAVHTPLSLGTPDWQVGPLAPAAVVGLLQMALVTGFFGLALVAGHRLARRLYPDARTASRAFVPMAGLALAFTLLGLLVLSLPMAMRHGS